MAFNVTININDGEHITTATNVSEFVNGIRPNNVSYPIRSCKVSGSVDGDLFYSTNEYGIFGGYYCTSIDISELDTSGVTNMRYLFGGSSSLEEIIGLKNMNTSNVTDMSDMFYSCSSLTSLDLSSFDTSNVTHMNSMFGSCSALTEIKVNKSLWDTSKLTYSGGMFYNCTSLPNYNSSYTDVTKAIDKSLGGYLDVIFLPNKTYRYYEHYSDGIRVIPKATDMFDFVTQEAYDSITNPDPDMLYFIIEE